MIPKQLQKGEFRFNLLKPKSKLPFEKWRENNYSYDDPKLLEHIKEGGNYGVLCGNGLIVIDCDNIEVQKVVVTDLPNTFRVSASKQGCYHNYYLCKEVEKKIVLAEDKEDNHFGEVQSTGSYVVGANSIHPKGMKYKTHNKEVKIAEITKAELLKAIKPFMKKEFIKKKKTQLSNKTTEDKNIQRDNICEQIKEKVSLKNLMEEYGYDLTKNPTRCLLGHTSEAEQCFSYDDSTGLWNCFHCGKGGDVFSFIMEHKNIDFIATKEELQKKVSIKEVGLPFGFIFNEEDIIKTKSFSFFENKNKAGIGILNPKKVEILDKKGEVIGSEQKDLPLVIFSDGSSKPYGARFREEKRIKFEAIPSCSERRWSLNSIKKYLQGEYEDIDGMKLFHKIKNKYLKFQYYSNEYWYDVHSIWDIGSYFFLLFKAYPIMELRGVRGSAKTKTMDISSFITFNATKIMINPSESTLFRESHERRPTKYIDEAEKLFQIIRGKVESDPRVEVINSSYSYNGSVPRQEKFGNKFKTIWYRTYSPTMVASINGLYGATEDRAIVHISIKSPKNDKRGEEEPEDNKSFQEIRDELYIFTLQNWKEIKDIYNNIENETKLRNRDYQIWKPLLTIAKFLDDELYENIKKASEKVVSVKDDTISEGSTEYKMLSSFYDLLKDKYTAIFTTKVREKYIQKYGDQYTPSITSFGRKLNDLGLMEYKVHKREGNCYEITKEMFETIISPIMPNLLKEEEEETIQTIHNNSHIEEKDNKISEEYVNSSEEISVKGMKSLKSVKTKTDREVFSKNKSDDDLLLGVIRETGKQGYSLDKFCKKYGEDTMKRLLEKGEITELPKGMLRVLE